MKKLVFLVVALTAASALAAAPSVGDLNGAVTDLLSPYQTRSSQVSVTVKNLALTADEQNVDTVSVIGSYLRVGKVQTLDVKVNGLRFDYANGNPIANVAGSAAFDLTQVFQQDQINSMIDGAEDMIADLASNYTKPYGAAATVKGTMIEKIADAQGNYTAFKASVNVSIDLSKLPAGKKVEDMPLLNATLFFDVTLNKGINLYGTVVLNPAYQGFHGKGDTLKLAFDKLLNRDGALAAKLQKYMAKLDKMAGNLVDAKIKD